MDRVYDVEIEGTSAKSTPMKEERKQEGNRDHVKSDGHLSDMRYIRLKIQSLRLDNEDLLHELIDSTFSLTVELPLPDIYQKRVCL